MTTTDQRTARLESILFWLRDLGCCSTCSLGLALWQTGRDYGEAAGRPELLMPCSKGEGICIERAREKWAQRPKAPPKAASHHIRRN